MLCVLTNTVDLTFAKLTQEQNYVSIGLSLSFSVKIKFWSNHHDGMGSDPIVHFFIDTYYIYDKHDSFNRYYLLWNPYLPTIKLFAKYVPNNRYCKFRNFRFVYWKSSRVSVHWHNLKLISTVTNIPIWRTTFDYITLETPSSTSQRGNPLI